MRLYLRSAALGLCAVCCIHATRARPDDAPKTARHALEGSWTMATTKQPNGEKASLPEGLSMVKFVANGRFVWTLSQDGKLLASIGGRYTIDDDHYSEKIEYVHGQNYEWMVGKTFKFTWKIEDNTWHHVGELKNDDGATTAIEETWTRNK